MLCECVCGAVCGVCRCVWLCVLWLWLWSWCCSWVMVIMVLFMGDGHDPHKKNSVKLIVVALPARNVSMSL